MHNVSCMPGLFSSFLSVFIFFVACQDFSRVANCWNLSLDTAGTCRGLQCLLYAGFLISFGFSIFVLVKLLVEFSSQD
jgi:hypothetical protein